MKIVIPHAAGAVPNRHWYSCPSFIPVSLFNRVGVVLWFLIALFSPNHLSCPSRHHFCLALRTFPIGSRSLLVFGCLAPYYIPIPNWVACLQAGSNIIHSIVIGFQFRRNKLLQSSESVRNCKCKWIPIVCYHSLLQYRIPPGTGKEVLLFPKSAWSRNVQECQETLYFIAFSVYFISNPKMFLCQTYFPYRTLFHSTVAPADDQGKGVWWSWVHHFLFHKLGAGAKQGKYFSEHPVTGTIWNAYQTFVMNDGQAAWFQHKMCKSC